MSQRTPTETVPLDIMSRLRLRLGLGLAIAAVLIMIGSLALPVLGVIDEIAVPVLPRLIALGAALVLVYLFYQKREVARTTDALVVLLALIGIFGTSEHTFLVTGYTALIIAAILGSRYVYGATTLAFVAKTIYFLQVHDEHTLSEEPVESAGLIVLSIIISMMVRYISHNFQTIATISQHNTEMLHATAEVGQAIGQMLEFDELLNRAVNLIRDDFGYYHVQVFLIDEERKHAILKASTGHVGDLLIERGHQLVVGSRSVIGRVTQVGEPVLAGAEEGTNHARNELLPDTRSELALPITDGQLIIGALDVQSVESNAFGEADIQALQVMANQLAVAIRNARLFETQAASLRENKRLFLESEANLREIQRLNRQLTGKAWEDYLAAEESLAGITVDGSGKSIESSWTANMVEASQKQRPVVGQGEVATIAVPIVLRGEVIGAIEVEPGTDSRTDDTTEMLRAVAGHLAVSLDNARLFEEAQESTVQEQRINEIVGRYQAALTVDDLLQITLQELGNTLGAQRGMIRLGSPQDNGDETETAPPEAVPPETLQTEAAHDDPAQ
jgi:GAF domain-containing protein